MAGGSLLTLLDDIAVVLDDVALMTKVAAKKTAGVLGDDLALNAQQVSGVRAERELPVVWAVFKGSVINKLILVPTALAISALLPWLIVPLLMLGGLYLCFEGVEKVWHTLAHRKQVQENKQAIREALMDEKTDLVAFEKDKIKGAIRTDFILSAEIIVIALGTASEAAFIVRFATIALIAFLMTIGVYGLVALIVKLDDIGLYMQQDTQDQEVKGLKYIVGSLLLAFCPWLMKGLSFFGTLAMFLVGGGIIVHGIPFLHHAVEHALDGVSLAMLLAASANLVIGALAGMLVLLLVTGLRRFGILKHHA